MRVEKLGDATGALTQVSRVRTCWCLQEYECMQHHFCAYVDLCNCFLISSRGQSAPMPATIECLPPTAMIVSYQTVHHRMAHAELAQTAIQALPYVHAQVMGQLAADAAAAGRTKEQMLAAAMAHRALPPHNLEGTTPATAYPLDKLIPEDVKGGLHVKPIMNFMDPGFKQDPDRKLHVRELH